MKNIIFYILLPLIMVSCIGDDIIDDMVDEQLRIIAMPESIAEGDTFQFAARFTNNVGQTEQGKVEWSSSDQSILTIDQNGLATALQQGDVTVIATVTLEDKDPLVELIPISVAGTTVVAEEVFSARSGVIQTTTFYTLEGDFTLEEEDGALNLSIAENYLTTSALPGLYIYLTNNPNTTNGAFEIGLVEVYEGAHNYKIEGVGLNDYDYVLYFCKPFNVKVGDGKIN